MLIALTTARANSQGTNPMLGWLYNLMLDKDILKRFLFQKAFSIYATCTPTAAVLLMWHYECVQHLIKYIQGPFSEKLTLSLSKKTN